ncbi:MAG: hypothetical protein AAB729_02415, partial [Patescibacteria group bacterium]
FHCLLATGCTKVQEPKSNPSEIIELVTMTLQEWVDLAIRDGGIDEPSAVVATARALPCLLGMASINLS